MAKETVKDQVEAVTASAEEPAEAAAAEKKTVKIKLFKDNVNYKDDVFVSVNGENFQIQRGKEVEVPDYIAEVLRHSEEQDAHTSLLIEQAVARAEKAE